MALYLISREDEAEWDEFRSFLVRADTPGDARRLITGGPGGRPYAGVRDDGSNITVVEIPVEGEAEVIYEETFFLDDVLRG